MQKPMIKKIVGTAIATVIIIAIAVTFDILFKQKNSDGIECSETFSGYISQTTYASREASASAFVSEQLSGADGSPVYSDCTVLSDMSRTEIEKLNAPANSPARNYDYTIVGGENCEITYRLADAERRIKADILRTENDEYLYRVRLPEKGEQPTRAYLDSIFDGDKYLNCTSRSYISATVMGTYNTYLQTIRFANDRAQFNQELPGLINEAYLRESDDRIIAYIQMPNSDNNGDFYTISEINAMLRKKGLELNAIYLIKGGAKVDIDSLHSMSDVTDFAFMMPIDCSYFIKTDYGFAMTADKYKQAYISLAGKDFAEEFDKLWHDYKVNFRADYYVTEGRLSRMSVTLQMAYKDDLISITVNTTYSEFGTTEVNIPHV